MNTTSAAIPDHRTATPTKAPSKPPGIVLDGTEKSCVLSGSGPRYPAHLGAMRFFVKRLGVKFGRFCGISGGAIDSAIMAKGASIDEAIDIALSINPQDHLDSNLVFPSVFPWPFNANGIYKGDGLLRLLRKHIPGTMADMPLPLHIGTFNIEKGTHVIWGNRPLQHHNAVYAPTMEVATLVRASMSLPIIFNMVRLPTVGQQTKADMFDLHVDGGIGTNFPIDLFGRGENVIGFRFAAATQERKINNKIDLAMACVDGMIESSMREHLDDAVFAKQVLITTRPIGLDFNLNEQKIRDLIEDGEKSAEAWAKKEGVL